MKYILPLLLLTCSALFSQEYVQYSTLRPGDTVRPLRPQNEYPMRVYVFTDRSNCVVCMINIERFYHKLSNCRIEYIVFLDAHSQADAERFRKEEHVEFPIVGDEYQIYRHYYKIRTVPAILVLDRIGKVLAIESPTSRTVSAVLTTLCDSLSNVSTGGRTDLEEYFHLWWKLPIRDTSGQLLKSGWTRQLLVDPKRKSYVLLNRTQCQLLLLDSSATIRRLVPIRLDSLDCLSILTIDWIVPGETVLIYGATFQYPSFILQLSLRDTVLHNEHYIPQQIPVHSVCRHCFGNLYTTRNSIPSNPLLGHKDTTLMVLDLKGNVIAVNHGIDSIYSHHRLSRWWWAIFGCSPDSSVVSLFQFSRTLRFWDKSGNLLRVVPLSFSNTYRVPAWDIPPLTGKVSLKDGVPVSGLISNLVFRKIYIDTTTGLFLIPYRNEEYPAGVIDYTDASVKHREYLHFCRADGSPVFGRDLYAGNHFIPHDFRDGILIGTVLDSNGYLNIVAYKLKGIEK